MRFGILGPLRLHDGEREISVPAAKQRMLLAGLLLDAGRTQDAGRLTDIVWGDHPPPGERAALQMLVARLRRTVGGHAAKRIVTRPGGYLIEVKPDELDQDRFDELLGQGRHAAQRGQWDLALRLVTDALSQWSGSALQDVPSDRLHRDAVPRLDEARLSALQLRVEALLALGRQENLLGELRELVGRYPLRERFAEQLITALHQLGRRAEALAVYDQARRRLVAELGIEPGAGLRALQRGILAGTEAGPSRTVAAGPAQPAWLFPAPAQLPADIADFTGRAADLAALIRLLGAEPAGGAVPVVLITGADGIGKTTMAVHAGHRLRRRFPDGQLYADLRGASGSPLEPGDLLGRFLRGLGFGSSALPRDDDERAALYRSVLADRRVLVVLDDVRTSAQVLPLIPAGRGNAVLVTSRAVLTGLDGAERIRLRAFGAGEAAGLFRRIVGGERVSAESGAAADVLAACAGLPLAVRIAAAHLAASPERTIAGLASRLASAGDRLSVLDEDERGARAGRGARYAAPCIHNRLFAIGGNGISRPG